MRAKAKSFTKRSYNDNNYPEPKFQFCNITNQQITAAFCRLNPHKAPGPNGLGNSIYKHCERLLTPYLGPIFRVTFNVQHYLEQWKESSTIVLRKPNKPDYTKVKAYRPIVLLDTMSKILTSCITRELTYNSIKHNTLAINQYGG